MNILCTARVIDGMNLPLSSPSPSLQRPNSPDKGTDGTSSPRDLPGSWRIAVGILLTAMALVFAACSGTYSNASSSTSPTSTPATSGQKSANLAMATKGTVGVVLVSSNGHTLYHLTTDTAGNSTCTGSCAQLWPPMTVPSGTMPTAVTGLSGTLGTITRSDGTIQVTYNGEPLYSYSPDTTASDALGQGVGGVWFAVKAPGSGTTTHSTSTPTTAKSGGYGY
jgi:predicted lipoprotein with Yx(FWY)xxD motif